MSERKAHPPNESAPDSRQEEALVRAAAPVNTKVPTAPDEPQQVNAPQEELALCLSGGGYRAMLFHLGALWRLNELAYLPRLDRVSSVSGGSITAGVLAQRLPRLEYAGGIAANFDEQIVAPLRALAGRTIDSWAIVLGLVTFGSIGNRIAGFYRRHLFGEATLQQLPDHPRFVFNATSLQSGVLFRFSKPYLWDWRVGEIKDPDTQLAIAVAASSGFPPFLSPIVLKFHARQFVAGSGEDLQTDDYRKKVTLTDGGVYDNLGLETAWKSAKTVLVSDGGGHMRAKRHVWRFWPLQLYRVLGVIDNQVRSLRKRQAIDGYEAHLRRGTYWGIRSHVADYDLADALPCPIDATQRLAEIKTRLGSMSDLDQERLINWGYAICDTAMRKHVEPGAAPPQDFPYPRRGLG
jgi:NTE family protein